MPLCDVTSSQARTACSPTLPLLWLAVACRPVRSTHCMGDLLRGHFGFGAREVSPEAALLQTEPARPTPQSRL